MSEEYIPIEKLEGHIRKEKIKKFVSSARERLKSGVSKVKHYAKVAREKQLQYKQKAQEKYAEAQQTYKKVQKYIPKQKIATKKNREASPSLLSAFAQPKGQNKNFLNFKPIDLGFNKPQKSRKNENLLNIKPLDLGFGKGRKRRGLF